MLTHWNKFVELAGVLRDVFEGLGHLFHVSSHAELTELFELGYACCDLFKDAKSLFDGLSFESRDRKPLLVDADLAQSTLMHGHVGDLFDHVLDGRVKTRWFCAVLVVEGCQIVLMLHVRVVNLSWRVLLFLGDKVFEAVGPLITRLLLEDG